MTPLFVADVGNSRAKWGEARDGRVVRRLALPIDDVSAWESTLAEWHPPAGSRWVVAGSRPPSANLLAAWLAEQGFEAERLTSHLDLPLRLDVLAPEKVGVDRLLNAVAVVPRLSPRETGVVVDAGTALTCDLVTADGVFLGGAIAPGLRLMAKALRDHTALLPLVEFDAAISYPGRDTASAIRAGIAAMLSGGVERMVADAARRYGRVKVFVTGGDAEYVGLATPAERVDSLTLEGIAISVGRSSP